MLGQANQRIAELRAPVLTLMLGKQVDSGLHHRGHSQVGWISEFYRSAGVMDEVFRGALRVDIASFVLAR